MTSTDPGAPATGHDPGTLDRLREDLVRHQPRLVQSRHVQAMVHGSGALGRFNSRLALAITRSVGTMWAAYLFALIALVSLPQALGAFQRGDTVTGINWLAQSFLQLVLLPIIIVGQQIISAAQDARAEADHETLTALQAINVQQLLLLQNQRVILDRLDEQAKAGVPATAATGPGQA